MNAKQFSVRYGSWALVTGASDGIGRAFAQQLAAAGVNVVLAARRQHLLEALAAQLTKAHGVQCRTIACDLAQPEAAHALERQTQDLDLGLLVAAAGFGTSGLLVDGTIAEEIDMVNLNCKALLVSSWYCAKRFAAQKRGGIVLISSLVAFHGTPRAANYAATKAYVQTLAEGLRVELAPHCVDVLACAPGPVRTGFAARANMQLGQALDADVVARVTLGALGKQTTVRPGWLSKLLGWSLAMLPRWGQIRVITTVMKGMTAHQKG